MNESQLQNEELRSKLDIAESRAIMADELAKEAKNAKEIKLEKQRKLSVVEKALKEAQLNLKK